MEQGKSSPLFIGRKTHKKKRKLGSPNILWSRLGDLQCWGSERAARSDVAGMFGRGFGGRYDVVLVGHHQLFHSCSSGIPRG